MSPWIWFGLALVLGIIELMSTTFILLWVAIAAVVTGLLSFPMHFFDWQLIVFVVLSVVLLMMTRPLVKRWRSAGSSTYRSSVQDLEGKEGVVMARIANGQAGMVRIEGQVWSARAHHPEQVFERGETVCVREADGVYLQVERMHRQDENGN
ncbi:MAG: NfeD family protein [Firmicutes bacterium]|nr:NfeD family protein [Bacillota bacterium]